MWRQSATQHIFSELCATQHQRCELSKWKFVVVVALTKYKISPMTRSGDKMRRDYFGLATLTLELPLVNCDFFNWVPQLTAANLEKPFHRMLLSTLCFLNVPQRKIGLRMFSVLRAMLRNALEVDVWQLKFSEKSQRFQHCYAELFPLIVLNSSFCKKVWNGDNRTPTDIARCFGRYFTEFEMAWRIYAIWKFAVCLYCQRGFDFFFFFYVSSTTSLWKYDAAATQWQRELAEID